MLLPALSYSNRKRLQDFQRTGMYEFGKSAMEYVVDSMNSVGNVIMLHKIPVSILS